MTGEESKTPDHKASWSGHTNNSQVAELRLEPTQAKLWATQSPNIYGKGAHIPCILAATSKNQEDFLSFRGCCKDPM